ncbi:MAG: EscU/YscU/HrcU family type III secretion system export apparatus switch protein [bacterium]
MSQAKTEKPTPKRQRDARKKGNIVFSADACTAAVLCAGLIMIAKYAGSGLAGWKRLLGDLWRPNNFAGKTSGLSMWTDAVKFIVKASAVVILPVMAAGLSIGFLQVGPLFRKLKPDMSHINPAKGFKNLFNKKKMVDLVKTTLKFSMTVGVLAKLLWNRSMPVLFVSDTSLEAATLCFSRLTSLVFQFAVVLAALFGIIDYLLQKHRWLQDLKMSRQEVLQEYKEAEGDPLLKGLRKQFHQEMLESSLADRVSRSRFVVVNPTRYAVAVEYDDQWQGAPRVTAKGYMDSAAKIRAVAGEHNVPVLRHPPLARKLFELSIDQEIPEDLFQAIAELLVFIVRLSPEDKKRYR